MLVWIAVLMEPVTTVRTEMCRGASLRRRVEPSMWRSALEEL